jgi:hypothetical protein
LNPTTFFTPLTFHQPLRLGDEISLRLLLDLRLTNPKRFLELRAPNVDLINPLFPAFFIFFVGEGIVNDLSFSPGKGISSSE